MGSKGRSWSSRGREGSQDSGGVDASEGFALVRLVRICALWAARRFSQLPDNVLYHARPPWSWLFRASQVASLGVLLSGVWVMGILRFAGLTPLRDLLTGSDVRPALRRKDLRSAPTTRW
jgi:hypothetical protein